MISSDVGQRKVLLSYFDTRFAHLDILQLFFFEELLDESLLFSSLQNTVKVIPFLSSVLKMGEESYDSIVPPLYLETVEPSNVKFLIKEYEGHDEEEIFHRGKANPVDGIINFEDRKSFNKYFEHIEVPSDPKVTPFVTNTPSVLITYMILPKTKRSILAVSMSHTQFDLYTFISFMKQWQYFYNKNDSDVSPNPYHYTFDRSPLRPSEDYQENGLTSRFHIPPNPNIIKPSKPREYLIKRVLFSKERISELKKLALESLQNISSSSSSSIQQQQSTNDENQRNEIIISSHDVISVHIWKLFSPFFRKNEGVCETDIFPIELHIGFRNKVEGIDMTYFGNAVHKANISDLTRKDVLSLSFGDLCLRIRKLINEYCNKDVQSVIDEAQRTTKKETKQKKFDWNYGIYLNDWRFLGRNIPQFGSVKCDRELQIPGMFAQAGFRFYIRQPHQEKEKGGIVVYFPIEKELYPIMKDWDLSNPKTLQKMIILSKDL